MAKILSNRTAQYPLVAVFTFNALDTIEATDGVTKTFNAALVADISPLPPGAVVIGGELVVETVYGTTGAATASLGDSALATRYATTVNLKATARTPLTLTGFRYTEANDLRLTIAAADSPAGNVGKATVRLMYVIDGRDSENA
jgi:hypothetical protein